MSADLISILAEASVAGSAALLLVLVLRRPLRAVLGANAAYALWLCVPVALLAVLLPRGAAVPLALPVAWQVAPALVVTPAAQPQSLASWHGWLLPLWVAGALASLAVLAWQQRRFRLALGPLRRRDDGLYQSGVATAGLPAVAGVLRPRILLPADFELRYTVQEQSLVLQHERLHVRRGDLVANALVALLRCLFWFNPLLAYAQRRFRLDQELACDEGVIARNPRARRHYGEAMLKTHFDELPLPLGCHWQARHPIQERIDMLRRPTPTPLHWMAALLFAAGLSASAGYVAWAAQPGDAPAAAGGTGEFVIARQATHGGVTGGLLVQQVVAGEPATSTTGHGEDQWASTVVATAGKEPGTTYLRFELKRGDPGVRVAQPSVLVRDGEAGAIEQRDDAGAIVYRVVFRVLPVTGTGAETQERMRQLLAEGGLADHAAPSSGDGPKAALDERMPAPTGTAGGDAVDRWAQSDMAQSYVPAFKSPADQKSARADMSMQAAREQPGVADAFEERTQPDGIDEIQTLSSTSMAAPAYPVEAARSGIEGEVIVLVTVGEDGRVRDAEIASATPPGVFDDVVLQAARNWQFEPAMRGGKPIKGRTRVPVTFELGPIATAPTGG